MSQQWMRRLRNIVNLAPRLEAIHDQLASQHRAHQLFLEREADARVLAPYGFSAYSMGDEDGIIQEIFRRIGTTNRQVIEFGCGDGRENNSVYLLLAGWRAFWMDGGDAEIQSVRATHAARIDKGDLAVRQTFITRSNINELIGASGMDEEIDLLVIDIDGNDYHVWEAITAVRPRVVVIEYNPTFRPPLRIVQDYKSDHVWDRTNYFGASLSALQQLGESLGYSLVGCNYGGHDSFFVRNDLVGDCFAPPFTAEHHHRPAQYGAFGRKFAEHPRGFGPYTVL